MYESYTAIGLILVVFGVLSSAYFVYFIKTNGSKNLAITSLSESLIAILIGIFYISCTSIVSQNILSDDNNYNISFTVENLSDIVVLNPEEEVITSTTLQEDEPTSPITHDLPHDDFLTKYQTLIQNMINKRPQLERRAKSLHDSGSKIDCFSEICMESSMYLFSFIHCVLSLVIATLNWKDCEFTENCNADKKVTVRLAAEIVTEWLLPTMTVILLYLSMSPYIADNMIVEQFENFTQPEWLTIIQKPPENVTTYYSNRQEVDKVISRVYEVVNNTKHNGIIPPKMTQSFEDFLMKNREPKAVKSCDNAFTKLNVLFMALLYFVTILYSKTTQIRVKFDRGAASRLLNVSILMFASLWLPGLVGMFAKAFLTNHRTSRSLSDFFLALGNLNRLSTIGIGYVSIRNLMKRINTVQPKV